MPFAERVASSTIRLKLGDKVIGEVEVTEGMTDAEFADAVAGLTFNINDGTTDHAFTGAVDTAGGTAITFRSQCRRLSVHIHYQPH